MNDRIDLLIKEGKWKKAILLCRGNDPEILKRKLWIYRMEGRISDAFKILALFPEDVYTKCERAILFRMKCDFPSARKEVSSALKIFTQKEDFEGIAFACWVAGGIERYGGKPEVGLKWFERAFACAKDTLARAYILCGLGGCSRLLGKFEDSRKFYKRAQEIFLGKKDVFGIAYSYCGLGSAERMLGNFETSKEKYKKAISLYKKMGDFWDMAYSLWGYSQSLFFSGNRRLAFEKNNLAKKIFKKFSDPRGVFYCILQDINFKRMMGDFSYKRIPDAEKIFKKIPLEWESTLLKKQKHLIKSRNIQPLLIP